MAFTAPLTYKGRAVVRKDKEIYYGNMQDKYIAYLQVLSTTMQDDMEVADRVHITILLTDTSLPITERLVKQSDKTGLYAALEFANIFIERAEEKEKN